MICVLKAHLHQKKIINAILAALNVRFAQGQIMQLSVQFAAQDTSGLATDAGTNVLMDSGATDRTISVNVSFLSIYC